MITSSRTFLWRNITKFHGTNVRKLSKKDVKLPRTPKRYIGKEWSIVLVRGNPGRVSVV